MSPPRISGVTKLTCRSSFFFLGDLPGDGEFMCMWGISLSHLSQNISNNHHNNNNNNNNTIPEPLCFHPCGNCNIATNPEDSGHLAFHRWWSELIDPPGLLGSAWKMIIAYKFRWVNWLNWFGLVGWLVVFFCLCKPRSPKIIKQVHIGLQQKELFLWYGILIIQNWSCYSPEN